MHLNFTNGSVQGLHRFKRLGLWYAGALGMIAVVAIAGQLLIQWHLSEQATDSRIINVAGKQRMLTREISKTVLMLSRNQSEAGRNSVKRDLLASLSLWKRSHEGLQSGNDSLGVPNHESQEVTALFSELDEDYQVIKENAERILFFLSNDPLVSYDSLRPAVEKILRHDDRFVAGMESIVHWYDVAAARKVSALSKTEYLLLSLLLVVILLEIVFIFRPTARRVNETMNQLVASEKNARKLSKEIGALYASLEKSYEQLAMVNQPVDNPRLYAKADRGGNVFFISDHFKALAGVVQKEGMRISDVFKGMENADDWMDSMIDTVSDGHFWQGQLRFQTENEKLCHAMIMITPAYNESGEIEELLVMGTDITERKSAEKNMRLKNRAEIEKKINQQKFRSVLILEGQEEERNRIAMDIHDGIGQMLTSLKYQIESIDLNAGERAERKLTEVGQLIKQVIREVRRVTFNLKPTVLGDYGLQAALNVFIQETAKLVDVKLTFKAAGEMERLPQKVENNIFRIIQEAINNAIKYSGADVIEVTLAQSEGNLVITVRDEGKGFDTRLVEARSVNIESGRGFFNMYERTEYVNGDLTIQSKPNEGTTVTLKVPIKTPVSLEG